MVWTPSWEGHTHTHTHTHTQSTPQQLGKSGLVGGVLDDPQLHAGAVLLPELLVVLLVHLLEHVQRLPHQLLLNDLQQFVLLEHLTRDVQWKVI